MTAYELLQQELSAEPRRWLVTGCAGFIGSHLLETLLKLGQRVTGIDNLSTGSPRNLEDVRRIVGAQAWRRFKFFQGTVADIGICREAGNHADYVLHQAGFVSVPLSLEDPVACYDTNSTGTLNILVSSRDNRVRRVVYASTSAVYGDEAPLPVAESYQGRPLSPYGATKAMAEIQARLFDDCYGLETVGLRYFNVFGRRQNPFGGYAAVIPQWTDKLLRGETCTIHGDTEITRDFCAVEDVVQANLLAATATHRDAAGSIFNVGGGSQTTLGKLHGILAKHVSALTGQKVPAVKVGPPRPGDISHSGADIAKLKRVLRYRPTVTLDAGLKQTVHWYLEAVSR